MNLSGLSVCVQLIHFSTFRRANLAALGRPAGGTSLCLEIRSAGRPRRFALEQRENQMAIKRNKVFSSPSIVVSIQTLFPSASCRYGICRFHERGKRYKKNRVIFHSLTPLWMALPVRRKFRLTFANATRSRKFQRISVTEQ